jgi:flavin reductase (DIM6/NTAB) family NADH-FMN oxidoreductase RutF
MIDTMEFRRILGHYPTGVCVVTAMLESAPVGMVVGSFTSVSLDPPLVAFFPNRNSTSWPKIQASGRFCVNILAEHQEDLCRTLSSKLDDKFQRAPHRASPEGNPILDGVIAWIDCSLYAVHEAGDHFIAIGEISAFDVEHPHRPLLFFRGDYGQFSPFMKTSE